MTDEVKEVVAPVSTKEAVAEVKEAKDVEKLSDNDIKWRAKYKLTKSEYEEAKLIADREKSELLSKVDLTTRDRQMLEKKLIEAELKAVALSQGLRDLDLIPLIDTSNAKLNEAGKVEGLEQAVLDFKTRKPDFFGHEKKVSSSTNAPAGGNTDTKAVMLDARGLTNEDWKRNKMKYMSGNFS